MSELFKKAAVIGDPIDHSLSPIIHNGWLKEKNIQGEYYAKRVEKNELKEIFEELKDSGFSGFNITLPHKETALELVDEVEETAEIIGAVNTVIIDNGKLMGFNTDAYGFWQNLKTYEENIKDYLSYPVILGAGGAARSVVFALKKAGAEQMVVIARNVEKAESLREITENIHIADFSKLKEHLPNTTLLVNTTPLGMKGKQESNWDISALSKSAIVTDIIYNPLETKLLKGAKAHGCKTIDGLGMLIYQALPGFEAWFGARPDMDAAALEKLKQQLVEQCKLSA